MTKDEIRPLQEALLLQVILVQRNRYPLAAQPTDLKAQKFRDMPRSNGNEKYFNVYKAQYRLAVQDPDMPQPRYHTVVSTIISIPTITYAVDSSLAFEVSITQAHLIARPFFTVSNSRSNRIIPDR